MATYEIDGMVVDQVLYWWDQPVSYLGRVAGGDGRPCLVLLVEDGASQIYHRMTFDSEVGLRATLAAGAAPTPSTYAMATEIARLEAGDGDALWTPTTYPALLARGERGTSLPPGRSSGDVPRANWGEDHRKLLMRLSQAASDDGVATMDYGTMRINPQNHLVQAAGQGPGDRWNGNEGTRVGPDGAQRIGHHDDFDCVEEMEAEGLVDIVSTARGEFRMTERGRRAAAEARQGTPA